MKNYSSKRSYITHTVGDRDYNFYPPTYYRMAKFRGLATDIATSVQKLLHRYEDEAGVHHVQTNGSTEIIRMPKSEPLSMHHAREKQKAMTSLLETLLDEPNMIECCGLILSCLRDENDGDPFKPDQIKAFAQEVTLPDFVQFMVGVAKASQGLFGSFGKGVQGSVVRKALERLNLDPEMMQSLGIEADESGTRPESVSPDGESSNVAKEPLP